MDKKTLDMLESSIKFVKANSRVYVKARYISLGVFAVAAILLWLLAGYPWLTVCFAGVYIYFFIRWGKMKKVYDDIATEMDNAIKRKIVKMSDTAMAIFNSPGSNVRALSMGVIMMSASATLCFLFGLLIIRNGAAADPFNPAFYVIGHVLFAAGLVIIMPAITWALLMPASTTFSKEKMEEMGILEQLKAQREQEEKEAAEKAEMPERLKPRSARNAQELPHIPERFKQWSGSAGNNDDDDE